MVHYRVVAGLGNPGPRYAETRHNAGFMVLDAISREQSLSWRSGFGGECSEWNVDGEKVFLLKPQRFMNLSGESVGEVLRFFKVGVSQLIVIHDEIDLPLGTVRIKAGGGDGGHNGLKSVPAHGGGGGYARVRIGVGRPLHSGHDAVSDWVLGRFGSDEASALPDVLERGVRATEVLLREGLGEAQRRFN